MSSFDPTRRCLLGSLGAVMALSACGFAPVFSDGRAATSLLGNVAVDSLPGREGFILRERLRERLGGVPVGRPRYRIGTTYTVSSAGLNISQSASITRFNLTGVAEFSFRDAATGDVIFSETVQAVSAYSTTGSAFAAEVAERDAQERLALTIADRIASRVALAAEALPR
jgi:LPS-assembly lipoprotein